MEQEPYSTSNPNILGGKPINAGTRISVDYILECLGSGWTIEQMIDQHPPLSRAEIRAAIAFAREAVSTYYVQPIERASS